MKLNRISAIISVSLILTILVTGCEEKIDLNLNTDENVHLVVCGKFTDELKIQQVSLSYTSSYFDNQPTPMVSNAEVTVTSEGESYQLFEVDSLSGIYRTLSNVRGTPGKTYTLNISTPDGENYTSTAKLNPITNLDSVTYDKRTDQFGYGDYYALFCWAMEPAGLGNYYFFNVYKDGKLDNDTLTESSFSDDSYFDGIYMYGISIYYFMEEDVVKCVINDSTESNMAEAGVPDSTINKLITLVGDTIFTWHELRDIMNDNLTSKEFDKYNEDIIDNTKTKIPSHIKVDMLSISKEYYDFCYAVLLETDYSGSLFSGPPANVPTNISNGALGYWVCSAVSSYEFDIQP